MLGRIFHLNKTMLQWLHYALKTSQRSSIMSWLKQIVLGWAGIGLTFTRSGEGTQPGWLTRPGQKTQNIQHHVPSGWVLSGGAGWGELHCSSGVHWASGGKRELLCVFCLFCIFLLSVLLLLFTSFAVLLTCPYPNSRALRFSSDFSPHHSRGRDDRATAWSFVASQGQTTT